METTLLVLAGKKLMVPRLLKGALQIAVSVGLTLLVAMVIQAGDGLYPSRNIRLGRIIRRPDILAIINSTALITVLFIYWQRDQERK